MTQRQLRIWFTFLFVCLGIALIIASMVACKPLNHGQQPKLPRASASAHR